jgi:hypothetical protein
MRLCGARGTGCGSVQPDSLRRKIVAVTIAYYASIDKDGKPDSLLRFVDHAWIEYLDKRNGEWKPSAKCVAQLHDVSLDQIDAGEAVRVAKSFGQTL